MFLLYLPKDLICLICLQWIELNEVSKLDSAICNRNSRTLMLKYMYGADMVYSLTNNFINELTTVEFIVDKFLEWCLVKNVIMDTFMFSARMESNQDWTTKFLDRTDHSIRTLIICNVSTKRNETMCQLLQCVVNKCPNVEKIHCGFEKLLENNNTIESKYMYMMRYLIEHYPNLQEIFVPSLSIFNLQLLAYHCKRMRSITISGSSVLPWTAEEVQKSVLEWPELEIWSAPLRTCIDFGYYSPNLRELRTSLACFPWNMVKNLAIGCPNLEHINLSTRAESPDQLTQLLCSFSQLKYIYVPKKMTEELFIELIDKLDHVRHISIKQPTCHCIATNVMVRITQRYPRLQSFLASDQNGLTDQCFKILSEKCQYLEKLHFYSTFWNLTVTERGLLAIIPISYFLHNLDIGYTCAVSNTLLQALADHCPRLEVLSVYNAENVNDTGLNALSRGCRHLKRMYFMYNATFTVNGVLSAVEKWNKLVLLKVPGKSVSSVRHSQLQAALGEKIYFCS